MSGDLVSSWPVGDYYGEDSIFLWAGVHVALCQSAFLQGSCSFRQSLYQWISQLLLMGELR